jgi:adenine phosphoribosyltransferase
MSSPSSRSLRILIASTSPVKVQAITEYYTNRKIQVEITTQSTSHLNLPAQPIGDSIAKCANLRLDSICQHEGDKYDIYVAIENGLHIDHYADVCVIAVIMHGIRFTIVPTNGHESLIYILPADYNNYCNQTIRQKIWQHNCVVLGFQTTFGDYLVSKGITSNGNDWFQDYNPMNPSRLQQIQSVYTEVHTRYCKSFDWQQLIKSQYQEYDNFPIQGVTFQDVFPVFANGTLVLRLVELLANRYEYNGIDYIVGLESRGFYLGGLLAHELSRRQDFHPVGFIPVRKAGKLPGETLKATYTKEYGTDTFEMSVTAIPKDSRVVIIDDLIASGGSLKATKELVEHMGGIIVDCCVLTEVKELRNQAQLNVGQYTVLLGDTQVTANAFTKTN